MTGDEVARAAEALVGTPFRLHGRDPATGLDCIGLVEAALGSVRLPNGYRVKNRALPDLGKIAAACRYAPAKGQARPGDVLVLRAGPGQFHLAIATQAGFVHAHAGLGRVVHADGAPPWPVLQHFRPL